jgi:metal-sulfur cluster biosynthetic enzyme
MSDEQQEATTSVPAPLPESAPKTTGDPALTEAITRKLLCVEDPEIHVDIVNLGLVYTVDESEAKVDVKMTLTSPGCPYGPMIIQMTKSAAFSVEGVKDVSVEVIWSPQWDPRTMASEDAKATLGIWD